MRSSSSKGTGFAVTLLEPDESGRVPPEAVRTALRADTLLVSLMLANNEIGVLNDLGAIAACRRERGVLLHTDASQAVRQTARRTSSALGVDLLSFTAHKFYGPKGIGALYVREAARPRIAPIQFGGGHERGLRSGTLPTHQIVGLRASPPRWRARSGAARRGACARLAARLWRELETIPGVELQLAARQRRARHSSMSRSKASKAKAWSPGFRRSRCPRVRPAARRRASRATCCARWAASTELAQSSLRISPRAVHDARRTSMRPPRRSAARCRACACWRAAASGAGERGSTRNRRSRRAACWRVR